MTKLELLSISTAEIIGERLEVSVSTTRENTVYVFCLSLLAGVSYDPIKKVLDIAFLSGEMRTFFNIISVENTQELNQ